MSNVWPSIATPHARPRVLVVDDSSINRQILAGVLAKDYEVETAEDGASALALAIKAPPELVLLDIMMPGIDGYEVCRRMRANSATANVPVIFVTAVGEEADELKGFQLGAVDFMTKPLKPALVIARVRTQIELRRTTESLATLSRHLSRFLPGQLYESILANRDVALKRTQRRKLTVFFSDIVDFTHATESMDTEDFTAMLNAYLETMAAIVIRHGGTLDKFIGDAVMVFFGDPESRGVREDAVACVAMALDMRSSIATLNEKWREDGLPHQLRVRMGIATGFCTVGNFGCSERLQYTVFGSPVNLASRLEHVALPGQILVASDTFQLIEPSIVCEPVSLRPLKGFRDGQEGFAVVDFVEILASGGELERRTPGFHLSVQASAIRDEDRLAAISALRDALALLRAGPALL